MTNGILELSYSSYDGFLGWCQMHMSKNNESVHVENGVADFPLKNNLHAIWDGYENRGYIIDMEINSDAFIRKYLNKKRKENEWPDNERMDKKIRAQYYNWAKVNLR